MPIVVYKRTLPCGCVEEIVGEDATTADARQSVFENREFCSTECAESQRRRNMAVMRFLGFTDLVENGEGI